MYWNPVSLVLFSSLSFSVAQRFLLMYDVVIVDWRTVTCMCDCNTLPLARASKHAKVPYDRRRFRN